MDTLTQTARPNTRRGQSTPVATAADHAVINEFLTYIEIEPGLADNLRLIGIGLGTDAGYRRVL